MAEVAISRRDATRSRNGRTSAARRPSVGWVTLLLHVLLISVTANSVVRVERDDRTAVLLPLAIVGLLLGWLVARTPALDAISHLVALLAGAGASLTLCSIRTVGFHDTWETHGRSVYELGRKLVESQGRVGAERLSDNDLLVVIGFTLWLVGYSSAWMLYRRHWLMPALLVPAVLVFINLRFEEVEPTASLAVFAIAAMIMAARHHVFVRQLEWARTRVPAPHGLPARFTASGSIVAVVALLAGWGLPFQAPNGVVDELADRAESQWNRVAEQWNRLGGSTGSSGFTSNIYTSFSDSFRIGGEFTPSDDPVASLESVEPIYLALRRYDVYNGHGWSSDVDSTFRMDGDGDDISATSVTFTENQNVALSNDVSGDREPRAGVVTVLRDKDGLLFTTDSFVGASVPTVAVLGWKQVNGDQIDIDTVEPTMLPVDLRGLVRMLKRAQFTADPSSGRPVVTDPQLAQDIDGERARLLQYPIDTSLSFGDSGHVVLTITGRLPNYDDIEAVFANGEASPTRYRVIGAESIASEDDLNTAGTIYPDWVLDRYLQLPTTVTAETVQLTADVIANAGAVTPFEKAWAIQEFLHAHFEYALNSEPAPADRDAVDFFLFDKKVGRCEDYATAMVVMLRAQGIPARLVAGYRAGQETDQFGDFVYREDQAHTWVEVFFPGYGWVPFEPTKGQAPFDYSGEAAPEATQEPAQPELIEPTPTPEPEPTAEATPATAPALNTNNDDDGSTWKDRLSGGLAVLAFVVTGGAALLVIVFAAVWAWGLRGLRPGAALYARTIRIGRLWGIEPDATMTPGEYATEFGYLVPRAGGAVRYVADLYAAEKYGGIEITEEARHGGQQAWRSVRVGVFSWRPWRRRGKGR